MRYDFKYADVIHVNNKSAQRIYLDNRLIWELKERSSGKDAYFRSQDEISDNIYREYLKGHGDEIGGNIFTIDGEIYSYPCLVMPFRPDKYRLDSSRTNWNGYSWTNLGTETEIEGEDVWTDGDNTFFNYYFLSGSTIPVGSKVYNPRIDSWTSSEYHFYNAHGYDLSNLYGSIGFNGRDVWSPNGIDIYTSVQYYDADRSSVERFSYPFKFDRRTNSWNMVYEFGGISSHGRSWHLADGTFTWKGEIYYRYYTEEASTDDGYYKLTKGSDGNYTFVKEERWLDKDMPPKYDLRNIFGVWCLYDVEENINIGELSGHSRFLEGQNFWTDGKTLFYSGGKEHAYYHEESGVWLKKEWRDESYPLSNCQFYGRNIWTSDPNKNPLCSCRCSTFGQDRNMTRSTNIYVYVDYFDTSGLLRKSTKLYILK